MDDTRPFPIQGYRQDKPSTIPWWLAEEAYKQYSLNYGQNAQSLERIAERGGFGREELLWLLRGNKHG